MEEKIIEEPIKEKISAQERKELLKFSMPTILFFSMIVLMASIAIPCNFFDLSHRNVFIFNILGNLWIIFAILGIISSLINIIFIIISISMIFSFNKNRTKLFGCLLLLIQILPFLVLFFVFICIGMTVPATQN